MCANLEQSHNVSQTQCKRFCCAWFRLGFINMTHLSIYCRVASSLIDNHVIISLLSFTWWRHQIKTFSALLAFRAGNSLVTDEFSSQSPVTQSVNVFFDLHLNKSLSKQSRRRWFQTLSRSLCHCDESEVTLQNIDTIDWNLDPSKHSNNAQTVCMTVCTVNVPRRWADATVKASIIITHLH